MYLLRQLWSDERGVIATTDLVLISTILVLGLIVGLTTLRDHVVQEFADVAAGVGALNQGYSFAAVTITFDTETFTVGGSDFDDNTDKCDTGDPAGAGAQCVDVCQAAGGDG